MRSARDPNDLNLVTGAFGFCASHVIRLLLADGQRVIGTDRQEMLNDRKHREMLSKTGLDLDHPNLKLVAADLLDPDSVDALFDEPITRVFHTASLYDYSAPLERLRQVNVVGGGNLFERAAKANLTSFVHWSTAGVFGHPYTTRQGAKVNVPFTEESSSPRNTPFGAEKPEGTHLVNAYSISKWEQEQLAWKCHRDKGLPLTVIRPGPMYGPGSTYGHGGIILAMARGLIRGVLTDARNYINASVHVEDVARFACFVAQRQESIGEDYNVVDSSVISQHEFLMYIGLLTGRQLRNVPFIPIWLARWIFLVVAYVWGGLDRHLGVPRLRIIEPQSVQYIGSSYWLSNRKSRATGFEYRFDDVRDGLVDTVTWFREVGWLYAKDAQTRRDLLLAKRPAKKKKELEAPPPSGDWPAESVDAKRS